MIWIKQNSPLLFIVIVALLSNYYRVYGKTVINENKHEIESYKEPRQPFFDIRALHLTLRKSTGNHDLVKQTKEDVIRTIQKVHEHGFNTLILGVSCAIHLKKTPKFSSKWAYSIKDIKEIIAVAREQGMDIIAEVKLLTHQKLLMLQINKELMLNEDTYDPSQPKVYEIIYPILDEIIEIFQPKYIHIGHDEVFSIRNPNKLLNSSFFRKEMLNPEDYLADVVRIYKYLKSRDVGTMMWADMLLDPVIFGNKYDGASVNGYNGYAKLINYIPKDIILCDWHYFGKSAEFPTYTYLQKQGFTVWGAVWKEPKTIKDFSAYVAKYARKGEGMIATTWWPFVIQDRETIDLILETSSKAFFKENEN
ncbi:MAG: family 20 glycosylhydrolase [Candidatus Brocadia sp.]|nr:family 20 glycosylhydrolase [Candidatus Brocadia sp.]